MADPARPRRSLRIAILSRDPANPSTRRLGLVALARGHEARVVDPHACTLHLGGERPRIEVAGEPLEAQDAVIPRVGPHSQAGVLAVLRLLEQAGTFPVNPAAAIALARDKLASLQLLAAAGIPVVPTVVPAGPDDVPRLVEELGGPPVVLKIASGAQGRGVVLAESLAAARSILEGFAACGHRVLLQPRLPVDGDVRLLVVGERTVAAMRRVVPPGDFRANLHRGGTAEAFHPDPELATLAARAAGLLGLRLAGVDVLLGPDGPLVLEVNASPGLEGIEAASGVNVAGAVVRWLEDRLAGEDDSPVNASQGPV